MINTSKDRKLFEQLLETCKLRIERLASEEYDPYIEGLSDAFHYARCGGAIE